VGEVRKRKFREPRFVSHNTELRYSRFLAILYARESGRAVQATKVRGCHTDYLRISGGETAGVTSKDQPG